MRAQQEEPSQTGGPGSEFLAEAQRLLREVDPAAFLVPARILRRVIKQDRELPGLAFQVPHRKGYTISGERLLRFVEKSELQLSADDELPKRVILIAAPDEQELFHADEPGLLGRIWRLLFHARVHVALDERLAGGWLTPARVRERIDHVGQVEFDEIQAVLEREQYILPPANYVSTYVEFAALYLELRFFAPHWLPTYFPSVDDFQRIDALLAEDLDARDLYLKTRLEGAVDESAPAPRADEQAAESPAAPIGSRPSPRRFARLQRAAQRTSARGNSVRAAIFYMRSAEYAPADGNDATQAAARQEIETLTRRLQAALKFDDTEALTWREVLSGLLTRAAWGFWNPDTRLLYDLQKVCVDHERDIYDVNLIGWLFGRKPLKHPLPNQREVRMSKHLRSATARLTSTRLSGSERERLSVLLHDATHSAEVQLRARLRPLITEALSDVDLTPHNLPEQVAFRKLVEELVDNVVVHGYLTMGNLRDAISRNNLKLEDLSGIAELIWGDRLLRANRRLAQLLDGLYYRGEFYLRWLQRLSSVGFGTRVGRFVTQFILIPFGGAYVALEGVAHLVTAITSRILDEPLEFMTRLPNLPIRLTYEELELGVLLIVILHVPGFSSFLIRVTRGVYDLLRGILIDAPAWLARVLALKAFLRSRPIVFLLRFVLNPLLLTGIFWYVFPLLGAYSELPPAAGIALFLLINLLLNSRWGRNLEELFIEEAGRAWYRIRVRIFVALFEIVMEWSKQILEATERLLYAVDEWLRYKSGETVVSLAIKAVLGVVWSIVIFVIRVYVNLLIEPQINPIKHFPVVTVSHKIILPFSLHMTHYLAQPMIPLLGKTVATTFAGTTVFLLPGIFGFLVWEFKENWRVYAANRPRALKPVVIGSHGETMIRLLKPGLHSGTLPKLYAKLRRAQRKWSGAGRADTRNKYKARLHHLEIDIQRFVEREFLMLLSESSSWGTPQVRVGRIQLASNSLRIELLCPEIARSSLWIAFQEQSGWLLASVLSSGWLLHLTPEAHGALRTAIAGLYKMAGVDLVREQIESCFEPETPPYDVSEHGLTLWPGGQYDVEVHYNLKQRRLISPKPAAEAERFHLHTLHAEQLLYNSREILWTRWVEVWEAERTGATHPAILGEHIRVIPEATRVPLYEA